MIVAFVSGTTGMIPRLGKGFPCAENILSWRYQQFSCVCVRKFCLQVQRVQRPLYWTESSADLRNCWVSIVRNNIYLQPLFNVRKTNINHLKMPGLGCGGLLDAYLANGHSNSLKHPPVFCGSPDSYQEPVLSYRNNSFSNKSDQKHAKWCVSNHGPFTGLSLCLSTYRFRYDRRSLVYPSTREIVMFPLLSLISSILGAIKFNGSN
jgi:hypothetical protein